MDKLFTFRRRENETLVRPMNTYNSATKEFLTSFFHNKLAVASLVVFLGLIIAACCIVPFAMNPYTTNPNATAEAPNSQYWFGTDSFGRDMWSRTWWAILYSVVLSLVASTINIFIAILVGITSAYYRSLDWFFSYLMQVVFAVPSILILIVLSTSLGASWLSIILGLVITSWAGASQQIRADALKVKNLDFIVASRTLKASSIKIMSRFFVYALPTIITQYAILFPRMILLEAMLGFLGLSIPDVPTLGNLISSGRQLIISSPYITFIPTGFLIVLVGSFQFIAFGLEDAFSGRAKNKKPRKRKQRGITLV